MDIQHKKDKEETKKKLIHATGEIFMRKGYSALRASKIAYVAGVSKTLIYRYFGNVQELFKTYIFQKDYWISMEGHVDELLEANKHDAGRELAKATLTSQMEYFRDSKEMQQIMRWQITEPNDISRSLADARERLGEDMLGLADPYFKKSGVNFRALLAVIVAGIYYLILNAKVNGSSFCGIDVNKEDDFREVQKALKLLVDMAYDKAKQ